MQRKQMLANALLRSSQQATETPPDWNNMRLVPRMAPTQAVSSLVGALLGSRAQSQALNAQNQYFQGMFGPPQGAPQGAPQATGGAQAGPSDGSAPAAGTAPAQPSAAQSPMLLTGEPHSSQMLLSMMGPEEYGKALAGRYTPTEMQRMLQAAGIDANSPYGRQALERAVEKANYIAPIEQRQGSVERDPYTNAVIGLNPTNPVGGINLYDRQGNLTGTALAPGAAATIAQSSGAETAGKVANTPLTVKTEGGGETLRYPGQVAGLGPPPGAGTTPQGATRPVAPAPARAPQTGSVFDTAPKLTVPTAANQAPDIYSAGNLKYESDKRGELANTYGAEAKLADQQLQYNHQALGALQGADVGPLSDWLTHNRAALLQLGVPANLIPASGTVTPTLELNKYLKNAALQGARQIYGPRMTQMEVRLQTEEMSPSASMTRDAISSLIGQSNMQANYAKQRAQDYQTFLDRGGKPSGFEPWYAGKRPMTEYASMQAMDPQIRAKALQRLSEQPGTIGDFVQAFGWNPNNWH
jgi:hypothetical protein